MFNQKKALPHWNDLLGSSVVTADQLESLLSVNREEAQQVIDRYPMRINPYYLSLIRAPNDPIWKQAVPDIAEIYDHHRLSDDPLSEEPQSPVPNLIHRYPDRVVFLVSAQCAMFCRYCMRKRKVGVPFVVTDETIRQGLRYIQSHKEIRDVIVSGGDPFLLSDEVISDILKNIRAISHVEIIRIHTRVPCTLPQRITRELAEMLKAFHPMYINTHFNHPSEITPESSAACNMLADAGIPMGCQTVLLKGVNDTPEVMKQLMQKLLMIRVKPYYIHHPDLVRGTMHFHPSPETGLKIMDELRGHTSGLCVPQYMIDLPGGGGKIPLIPEYVIEKKKRNGLSETMKGKFLSILWLKVE